MSGGTKELVHVQLSSAAKSSIASEGMLHSTGVLLRPFMVVATADMVMVAMESSDEVRCGHVVDYLLWVISGISALHSNKSHRTPRVAFPAPCNTRQVQIFARNTSTGELSFSVAVTIGTYTHSVQGNVMSFLMSENNRLLVLSMSNEDLGATGGLVVLDVAVS